MPDAVVRMHLVQALTRAADCDARKHIRIVLDTRHDDGEPFEVALDAGKLNSEETVALSLEQWLLRHATNGVSEMVLARVLGAYATQIEDLGYIPRSWGLDNHGLPRKPTCAGRPASVAVGSDHERGDAE